MTTLARVAETVFAQQMITEPQFTLVSLAANATRAIEALKQATRKRQVSVNVVTSWTYILNWKYTHASFASPITINIMTTRRLILVPVCLAMTSYKMFSCTHSRTYYVYRLLECLSGVYFIRMYINALLFFTKRKNCSYPCVLCVCTFTQQFWFEKIYAH